jgi:prepilin-type N-terminal cleavage/methylation domain-containing protein
MTRLKPAAGFTLVELAISLMIIGLLLGAVLKGKELIANARVTQTVRQLKSYDTAVTAFRTVYNAWPGDIVDPSTRITDCTTSPCSTSGNGNSMIDVNDEITNFWLHLAKGGFISGVDMTKTSWYPDMVQTPFGGCNYVSYQTSPADPGTPSQVNPLSGNLYTIYACNPNDDEIMLFTPNQEAQIDSKMDDGQPFSGDVRGNTHDAGSQGTCVDTSNNYIESDHKSTCEFSYLIQN